MYDEQRQKIEALFRAHAQQDVAERQFYNAQCALAYANWLPSNRAPVHFAGRAPTISTAPYTMHTREEIAILQHEHAVRATEQPSHDATQAAAPAVPVSVPRAVPKFNLPRY